MNRVLITGVSGFVGSTMAKKLLEQDVEVYGLVRGRADGVYKRLDELGIRDNVKLIQGDVRDLYSLLTALDISEPDVIFHLAAQSYVPRSFQNPIETYKINTLGTINLAEAVRLKDLDTRIVFAGSSEEYGLQFVSEEHYKRMKEKYGTIFPEPEKIPELPIKETNPLRPMSPYAVSKVHGEMALRNYSYSYGLDVVISRAFNHEGALRGEHFVTSQIVKQVVEVYFRKGKYIELGNVNAFRDWSHVNNIIDGYLLLAQKGKKNEVYNQGSGKTQSVLTYVLKTIKELKEGVEIYEVKSIKGNKVVKDPLEKEYVIIGDYKIETNKLDKMLLEGMEFDLKDEGVLINTSIGKFIVKFSKERFRPAEVPILLADISKIKELGYKPTESISVIIKDQLNYFLSKL